MFNVDPSLLWILYLVPMCLGVLVGVWLGVRSTKSHAGTNRPSAVVGTWIAGIMVSHVVEVLLNSSESSSLPLALLRIWEVNSTAWGFPAGLAAIVILGGRRRGNVFRFGDEFIGGFVVGWLIMRLGCTFAFDHIGARSDFVLAMDYPHAALVGIEAGSRHNLGFYELLVVAGILVSVQMGKRGRSPGWAFLAITTSYALSRFLLEFMQIRDGRLAGLTAVQFSMLLIGVSSLLLWRIRSRSAEGESVVASFD